MRFNKYIEFAIGPDGTFPEKGTVNSTGYDIHVSTTARINPGLTMMVETNLKILLPYGHWGKLETRSSMVIKGLQVQGGVIDWDYRGEIKVMIHNFTEFPYIMNAGDKVAQLILHTLPSPEIHHGSIKSYDKLYLNDTKRGDKGFGHTGRQVVEQTKSNPSVGSGKLYEDPESLV
ncbi:dUTPase-like protein [Wolfiporia cocos MD-104 SS10]|uniref:Deoxyuridine 5'-triphosphate nucleotidohydrolase n=1 Tax=Wolfiporia cocos (strain MD-104) TaxID=742152 RepID=A0A2H3JI38_WOLCO|nr:dUTPase-like protein [Wolfiporia cocos MD-104 SS10]